MGSWERAERVLNQAARRVLTGPHYVGLLVARALLRLNQGRLDAAAIELAQASRAGARSDCQLSGPWFALEAFRAAFEGQVTQVREACEASLNCEAVWKIDVHPLVHVVRAEVDAGLRAPVAKRDRRLDRAHEAVARLQRLRADGAEAVIQRWGLERDIARAQAEFSRTTGPDPRRWRKLLGTETHVFWQLYDRWRLVESLLATGEHHEAADEVRAGHGMAGDLGTGLLRGELEALARCAGLTLDGVEASDPGIGGLTPRELDVLRLVARGRTNQEIAEELYIAPKTASAHLSHILSKLGVDNRVQAATVAERHGFGTTA